MYSNLKLLTIWIILLYIDKCTKYSKEVFLTTSKLPLQLYNNMFQPIRCNDDALPIKKNNKIFNISMYKISRSQQWKRDRAKLSVSTNSFTIAQFATPNAVAISPTIGSRALNYSICYHFWKCFSLLYISSPNLNISVGMYNSHTFKFREITVFLDASLVVRAVGRPVGAKVGFGYTVRPLRYHATVSSKPQLCAHPPHHSRKFYIRNPDSRVSTRRESWNS